MPKLNQDKARNQLARDPGRVVPCPHGQPHWCWDCLEVRLARVIAGLNIAAQRAGDASQKSRQS